RQRDRSPPPPCEELARQPGLADSRVGEQQDGAELAGSGTAVLALELRKLGTSAHKGRCPGHPSRSMSRSARASPSPARGTRQVVPFRRLPLGAVRPLREDMDGGEADALVHRDCAPIEASDGERKTLSGRNARGPKLSPA